MELHILFSLLVIILDCMFFVLGFIMSAVVYKWSNAEYERYNRKDPKLYENDK